MSTATDQKPDVKGDSIQISLQEANGATTQFRVKPTTKLGKIIKVFAERKGVPANTFRVMLDGVRVSDSDTPQSLELEDGDVLDVMTEQTGGEQAL